MGNVRVNSDLQIAGELRAPRVEGDLGVETGRVNLDEILALIGDSAYATEPDRVPDAPERSAGASRRRASPFDALKMDVHLTVPDDLVVKASELQTPGRADRSRRDERHARRRLRATKEPGRPIVLLGAVNTVRGNYDFQGRRFEILRDGTIRFDGEPLNEMDPVLDIRTRRMIQGVEARVNVRGTLKQPEIVLSQHAAARTGRHPVADRLQPADQLTRRGAADLAAQRAQQLATGAVAGQLAQSIGNALGVDTFEINTRAGKRRRPRS